ncbi:DUF805 domain-containing protein [Asticcacaulis excentricus]|uniref:DUF805 domain-containing protein n=1 Tax=Asticcacaulis excentricus (strain ATCC 15261 / DSM 4724 / KCTC 12464 / NCIMB 9791 / VKM B-1370 / CB 48) TaxID=573065 RepID=E8RMI4_ASTEC|nr:DUF805 domain-containing protein [Asticcacaulis excentricus]ADU12804.1 protein of unknown function DUF805 [Asticcacaulis excentricus CB 48]
MAVPIAFRPLTKYADFNGRARRQEFWLFWLVQFLFFSVLNSIVMALMFQSFSTISAQTDPSNFMFNPTFMVLGQVGNVISLALLVPNLAVGVRRLHDTNRTGWWLILPIAAFVVGLVLFLVTQGGHLASLFTDKYENNPQAVFSLIGSGFLMVWLPTFVGSVVLFVFNVLDGTPGANRFGPDPKGRGVTADVAQTFA